MKVAVVTGAGRGIGRLISEKLAARGYAVLATDIDEASARETARHIGGDAWSMAQDVRDPSSHRRVAEAAREKGEVAVWVNNAGVMKAGPAWENPDSDVKLEVEVNVLGVMWGARAAVEVMREQGSGHIINLASISSLTPVPGLAIYGATKQAVLGFSISLQGDLERSGLPIQVSAMCPDAIETDMVRGVESHEDSALLFSSRNLLKPEKVAELVVGLVDHPRLVYTYPPARGALAHAVRPFPSLGLKVLRAYWKLGELNRRRRGT